MRIKTEPHPLENITLRAFAEREHHDSSSLGFFLNETTAVGCYFPNGLRRKKSSLRVCIKAAKEVLETMEWQGKMERDRAGWYRQTETRPAIVFAKPLYKRPPRGTRKPKPTNVISFPRR